MIFSRMIFMIFLLTSSICFTQKITENITEDSIIAYYNKEKKISFSVLEQLQKISVERHYKKALLSGYIELEKHYLKSGDYSQFFKYATQAETEAKSLSDNYNLSRSSMYRGQVNLVLGFYTVAKTNFLEAIKLSDKINDPVQKIFSLSSIYASISSLHELTGKKDSTLVFLKKSRDEINKLQKTSLKSFERTTYHRLQTYALLNLANYYAFIDDKPDMKLVENFYYQAINNLPEENEGMDYLKIDVFLSLGEFYIKNKEYLKGIENLYKVLAFEKKSPDPNSRLVIYENLYKGYEGIDNLQKQNLYLHLFSKLNDSLNKANQKTIINNTEKDKLAYKKIADDEKIKYRNILIILFVVLFMTVSIGLYFLYKNKNNIISPTKNNPIQTLSHTSVNETIVADKDVLEEINPETNPDQLSTSLSPETENSILKKLQTFEDKLQFLDNDVKLFSLANKFKTNTKYLSMVIKKNKGISFSDYINQLRINYILDKLNHEKRYRDYKISYLAEESGYASVQVFSIAFKKQTGKSPSEYISELS